MPHYLSLVNRTQVCQASSTVGPKVWYANLLKMHEHLLLHAGHYVPAVTYGIYDYNKVCPMLLTKEGR